jgi:hypothetical protein
MSGGVSAWYVALNTRLRLTPAFNDYIAEQFEARKRGVMAVMRAVLKETA